MAKNIARHPHRVKIGDTTKEIMNPTTNLNKDKTFTSKIMQKTLSMITNKKLILKGHSLKRIRKSMINPTKFNPHNKHTQRKSGNTQIINLKYHKFLLDKMTLILLHLTIQSNKETREDNLLKTKKEEKVNLKTKVLIKNIHLTSFLRTAKN